MYTGTLAFLLEAHGVSYHFFADNMQLYIRVEDIDESKHRLSSLMSDLKIWMARKKLKLIDGKTEIIVIRELLFFSSHESTLGLRSADDPNLPKQLMMLGVL